MIKVICINEPDISYTRNKKLELNKQYNAKTNEVSLGFSYGIVYMYKIFDGNNYLGEYYRRDFLTVEEYRDKKLESILD
jgi:hypothetical protein